jgi:hypothetical protein
VLLVLAAAALALAIAAGVAAGGGSAATASRHARVTAGHPRALGYGAAILAGRVGNALPGRRGGVEAWRGDVPVAASYLGLAGRRVRRELRAGSSLAAIAAATRGKSQDGLIAAIVAVRTRRLSTAAAHGRLSGRAERRRLALLPRRVASEVARKGGPAPGAAVRRRAAALAPVTSYLGLSDAQLGTQLRAGHSLAQIANGIPGRSAGGLIAVLVAAAKSRLQAAVAAGRLSPAAEARRLGSLQARVAARVDRVPRGSRGGPPTLAQPPR